MPGRSLGQLKFGIATPAAQGHSDGVAEGWIWSFPGLFRRVAASALYCIAVWVANLLATVFLPIPGIGMVAAGTLVFGATFTLRDRVHHQGKRWVYAMIAVAALGMVLQNLFLQVPLRIVLASLVAIVLSETADTEIYHRLLHRSWWMRVASSNALSIPLDSMIFNAIAFAGVFPWKVLLSLVAGEILVKAIASAAVAWRLDRNQTQRPIAASS
jgi:uncharacterized PurR-regulated membrane protein YhhQ (DUF165 family)